jgi:hypothetical protein
MRWPIDYSSIFADAIAALHAEKRYRVFADLERIAGRFAHAQWRSGHKEIVVWCSNDYLGMGQNQTVVSTSLSRRCASRGLAEKSARCRARSLRNQAGNESLRNDPQVSGALPGLAKSGASLRRVHAFPGTERVRDCWPVKSVLMMVPFFTSRGPPDGRGRRARALKAR